MKKTTVALALLAVLLLTLFTGCATGNGGYKDGTYKAEGAADDKGWKPSVTVTIADGKVTKVDVNDYDADGKDKKTASKNGEYPMKAEGGAQAEWYEEIEKLEAELVAKQKPSEIKTNSEGKPDAISGVTIKVSQYLTLMEEALKNAQK